MNTATCTAWSFNHVVPLDSYSDAALAALVVEGFNRHVQYVNRLVAQGNHQELLEVLLDPWDTMDEDLPIEED